MEKPACAECTRLRADLAYEREARQSETNRAHGIQEDAKRLARENYGLMLMLSEHTGVSAEALRETAKSRADENLK